MGSDVCGSRTVRQSSVQRRKNASWRVSWRCSTSTRGSCSSFSSIGAAGDSVSGFCSAGVSAGSSGEGSSGTEEVGWEGFQVAAEGIAGPERAGVITRPWVAKMSSASSATAAIAFARSALNCLRSALRLAVISSEVISFFLSLQT